LHILFTVYFFFQAEDGIRDFHVTGVQTCALPISGAGVWHLGGGGADAQRVSRQGAGDELADIPHGGAGNYRGGGLLPVLCAAGRSEERRVGEEYSTLVGTTYCWYDCLNYGRRS